MEGMGGIEAARNLRQWNVDTVLVFITGIKEYVFEAFDMSAFHYLLKPIEEKKFIEVLGRAAGEAARTGQGNTKIKNSTNINKNTEQTLTKIEFCPIYI